MAKRLKLECFAICIIISFFLGGGITRFQQSKILYIFHCFNTTSSVKLFVVTVQIFVYKFLFTIVFFGKRKKKTHETFHILKMKTHFEKGNTL